MQIFIPYGRQGIRKKRHKWIDIFRNDFVAINRNSPQKSQLNGIRSGKFAAYHDTIEGQKNSKSDIKIYSQ